MMPRFVFVGTQTRVRDDRRSRYGSAGQLKDLVRGAATRV